MSTKCPAFATQDRALATVLVPAGLVVQGSAANTENRDNRIAVDVLLNCARTYRTVKTQAISLADVILRNRYGWLFYLVHF
jgi:hypothetical protein